MVSQKVGCGPPRLLEVWPNQTVTEGDAVRMYCPLDTRNSCLVQLVEWYFRLMKFLTKHEALTSSNFPINIQS